MTTRRLAAILAADVAGFSAMMECDEEGTYTRVNALRREVVELQIQRHHGRLVKTTGDGFLAEFGSPTEALRSALAIQHEIDSREKATSEPERLRLRIGINLGDIIVEEDGDVYGDDVNLASRLEEMADAGGILISRKIHEEVNGKLDCAFEDRGKQHFKNIARPVHVYAVRAGGSCFTADAFEQACKQHGVMHRKTRPYTPRTNGMVERFNGRVQREVLGITIYSHRDLETVISGFNVAYNGRRQRVLKGRSPNMVLRERLTAKPELANKCAKPPDPDALPRALQVIAGAREVSHPDS